MNDCNYDGTCMLRSLLVWDLENFKSMIFVAQSVQSISAGETGVITNTLGLTTENYINLEEEEGML
jgi:hypothetical protein